MSRLVCESLSANPYGSPTIGPPGAVAAAD